MKHIDKGWVNPNLCEKGDSMKVISVISRKGGVGKTSISIHLACELARKGEKVLLIDLDPSCDLSCFFAWRNAFPFDIFDILSGECQELQEAIVGIADNLALLPGSEELASFDRKHSEKALARLCRKKEIRYFDYVIIDHPPSISETALMGLVASQFVLIVAEPERFAMDNLQDMKEEIKKTNEVFHTDIQIAGILINKVDLRRNLTSTNLKKLGREHQEVLENYISVNTCFPYAAENGITLAELPHYPKVRTQLKKAIQELQGRGV